MNIYIIASGLCSLAAVIFFWGLILHRINKAKEIKKDLELKRVVNMQQDMGKRLYDLASNLCEKMNKKVMTGDSSKFVVWQIPDNGGKYTVVIERNHAHPSHAGEYRHNDPVVQMDVNLFDEESKKLHIVYGPYGPDNYFRTTSGLNSLIAGASNHIDGHYKNVFSA